MSAAMALNLAERRILSLYARDERIVDIAEVLRLPLDYVTGVIAAFTGNNRAAAGDIVASHRLTGGAP